MPVPATLIHKRRSRSTPSYERPLKEFEDVGKTSDFPRQPVQVKVLLASDVLHDHSMETPGGNIMCTAHWTLYGPQQSS